MLLIIQKNEQKENYIIMLGKEIIFITFTQEHTLYYNVICYFVLNKRRNERTKLGTSALNKFMNKIQSSKRRKGHRLGIGTWRN